MTNSLFSSGSGEGDIMNVAIRIVTPMRREFGRSVDLHHFLHDFAYAKEVLDQAKTSQDERLRGYAATLESRLLGPRYSAPMREGMMPASAASAAPAAAPNAKQAAAEESSSAPLTEAEMRAKMMSKYKSGLR
jgi:hypothetical protein